MDFSSLNYIAILVAALAAFFVGFMWHGPLFGKVWISLMKITPQEIEQGKKDMQKKMPLYMLASIIQQLVTAFVLALFMRELNVDTAANAMFVAFLAWFGFIATTLFSAVLWEKRSVPLYLFSIAYYLVALEVMAVIIAGWR